jgi:outer membrane protein assembly factor BamA
LPLKFKTPCQVVLAICLTISWITLSFATANTVSRIDIEGNKKTLATTILQELPYSVGDSIDQATFDRTAQAVKDLGLFETVDVTSAVQPDGTIVTLITVKEKRFNFILPKLNRNGDGDITTGIVWRSDNLFGRNQASKLTYSYRTFADADEENATQIKWDFSYPRIHNTPYSLAFTTALEETLLEETVGGETGETGEYERTRTFAKLLVGRWFNKEGPTQGLNIRAGPLYEEYEHLYISGAPGLLPDLTIQGLSVRMDQLSTHDNLLSRSGHHYGYEFLISDDAIGSDKNFLKHFLFSKSIK